MVEVFKTNVRDIRQAKHIAKKLAKEFPGYKINFDLSDRDKILRVQGESISPPKIISLLNQQKYSCEVLS